MASNLLCQPRCSMVMQITFCFACGWYVVKLRYACLLFLECIFHLKYDDSKNFFYFAHQTSFEWTRIHKSVIWDDILFHDFLFFKLALFCGKLLQLIVPSFFVCCTFPYIRYSFTRTHTAKTFDIVSTIL